MEFLFYLLIKKSAKIEFSLSQFDPNFFECLNGWLKYNKRNEIKVGKYLFTEWNMQFIDVSINIKKRKRKKMEFRMLFFMTVWNSDAVQSSLPYFPQLASCRTL